MTLKEIGPGIAVCAVARTSVGSSSIVVAVVKIDQSEAK